MLVLHHVTLILWSGFSVMTSNVGSDRYFNNHPLSNLIVVAVMLLLVANAIRIIVTRKVDYLTVALLVLTIGGWAILAKLGF